MDRVRRCLNKMEHSPKHLVIVLISCFVIYRTVNYYRSPQNKCVQMFQNGHALSDGKWHPNVCMTYTYFADTVRQCAYDLPANIFFIGDARLLPMFHEFALFSYDVRAVDLTTTPDGPFSVTLGRNTLCFFRSKDLTEAASLVQAWKLAVVSWRDKFRQYDNIELDCMNLIPTHIIIGLGTETLLRMRDPFRERTWFNGEFKKLASAADLKKEVPVFWVSQNAVREDLLSGEYTIVTNRLIDEYNSIAQEVFSKNPSMIVWNVTKMMNKRFPVPLYEQKCISHRCEYDIPEAFRASMTTYQESTNLWWNYRCNTNLPRRIHHCCQNLERINSRQIRVFVLIGSSFVIITIFAVRKTVLNLVARSRKRRISQSGPKESHAKSSEYVEATYQFFSTLSEFGLILIYFFICDRTLVFDHVNRTFNWITFTGAVSILMIFGLFSIRKSSKTVVNHVDITREWKGWMQLYILVYHYTDAYHTPSTYQFARICVSSYLFLSGFGHFSYLWQQGTVDFGNNPVNASQRPNWWRVLNRYLTVIFRMNLLVVSLCFVMNRTIMMYYFMPLVTFWFTVIYVLMAIIIPVAKHGPTAGGINPQPGCALLILRSRYPYLFVVLKLVFLSIGVEVCHRIISLLFMVVFTGVSGFILPDVAGGEPANMQSQMLLSQSEWYSRWSIDRFSVIYGVAFALLLDWLRQAGWIDDSTTRDVSLCCPSLMKHDVKTETKASRCKLGSIICLLIALIGFIATILYILLVDDRKTILSFHPFVCLIPIISYILLRNTFGCIRTRFSVFFAKCGDLSLELFISQYHIWLSGDAFGLLVLIPNYPTLNFILTTWIFVLICQELHVLTKRLGEFILPQNPQQLLSKGTLWILLVLYLYQPWKA